jgi:hypothetical protein
MNKEGKAERRGTEIKFGLWKKDKTTSKCMSSSSSSSSLP